MYFGCRLSGENWYLEDLPKRRQDTELIISLDHIRCQWTLKDRRADFVPTNSTNVELLISRNSLDTLLPKLPNGLKKGDTHFYVYGDNIKTGSKPTLAVIRAPPAVQRFIMSCLRTATEKTEGAIVAAKLLLPQEDGFIVRADFLERRLEGCEFVAEVFNFVRPCQEVKSGSLSAHTLEDFVGILHSAVGGVILKHSSGYSVEGALRALDDELINRLSFPWILPNPIHRKHLALVEGRRSTGIDLSKRVYEAASGLGIDIILLEMAGHWLEDDTSPFAHLREAFICVDLTVNDSFPERIAAAVRSYCKPIDGIMTLSDGHLVGVAKAAEILGLPTCPAQSFALSSDKYETRMLEPNTEQAFRVASVKELNERLNTELNPQLSYPLIVKPCLGCGSDCVSRVTNHAELVHAVEKASARNNELPYPNFNVVVEPYIDGPEVDANFVLWDGKVLFCEICDDFPCAGDSTRATAQDNFLETQMVYPSSLPPKELSAIELSIHQSILRLGFRSGVFHCEARVRYSSMKYEVANGMLDLYPQLEPLPNKPEVFLIEINARVPGYHCTAVAHLAYGVDYFAQQMLFAVQDEARFMALAKGFLRGPQHTSMILDICPDRGGIMKSDDPAHESLEKNPEIAANVVECRSWIRKGDTVPGPDSTLLCWLATYWIVSKTGRENLLKQGEEIRKRFHYELE